MQIVELNALNMNSSYDMNILEFSLCLKHSLV